MPAWKDYKAEAKSRGALAHELYVVMSTPADDPAKVKALLPEHLAYQAEQEKNGNLFMAGPMSDLSGDEMLGMGLIIYQADSLEAARTLAEEDPMHKGGARTFVLRRWMVNEGALSFSVGLSAQSVRIG